MVFQLFILAGGSLLALARSSDRLEACPTLIATGRFRARAHLQARESAVMLILVPRNKNFLISPV